MMRRAFRFLSREASTLERAVSILAASALLSSLLALLRDRLLAHTFGAGAELDVYYAAFRIPDLLFVTVGALVSVYILIPELARRNASEQSDYIDTVVAGFSILAFGASLAAYLFAPSILSALFPSLVGAGYFETLVALTRILLLQPILLGLSNILAAVTQVRARYGLYALSPILYNVGIIAGVLFFYPFWGLSGLAWGVVLGAGLHLGIQVPFIISEGFFRRFPLLRETSALFRTTLISVPRALALSLNQIAFIGLTALAATLSPGSVAVFMFAFNLNSVPLSVIGASYSVAAFPTLAKAFSNGEQEEFVRHVIIAARYVMFWSLPTIALIIILRAHLVRVVLGSGAFDWTDTRLTAAALAIFSVALVAQGLTLLLVRGYYAAGKTLVPFLASLLSAIGIILFGFFFLRLFDDPDILRIVETMMRVDDLEGTSLLALPLAYALVSIVALIALALHFETRFGAFFSSIRRTFFESTAAAFGAGLGAYAVLYLLGPLTVPSTLLSVFLRGFAGGIAGITAAALVYWYLRNQEFGETVEAIRARLWRAKPEEELVVSSAEDISPSSPQ